MKMSVPIAALRFAPEALSLQRIGAWSSALVLHALAFAALILPAPAPVPRAVAPTPDALITEFIARVIPKPQPAPKAAARQDESVLDKFRKIWKHEKAQAQPQAQPKQAEQPQPRRPMASAFNQAATKPNKADFQPDMEQKPNPQ